MIAQNKQESCLYVKNSFKASLFLFIIACATSLIYRIDTEPVDMVISLVLLFLYTSFMFLIFFHVLFIFYFVFKKIFKDGIFARNFARYSFYVIPTMAYMHLLYLATEFNFKETTVTYNLYLFLTTAGSVFGAYLLSLGLLILISDKLISFGQKGAQ